MAPKSTYPTFFLNRDTSSAMSSNNQMEMIQMTYNPASQTVSFGLSNHHSSQTLRRRIGCGREYNDIFHNIEPPPPAFDDKSQHTQKNIDELMDCRFYVAMKAPSGYCWKVETVVGPKLVSIRREIPPFPTLAEIIRFQLHKNLELDVYCKLQETLFHSSRYDYLNNILYPEICSQLDLLVTKLKLSTQLAIASRELKHRALPDAAKAAAPLPPSSSFTRMNDAILSAWIADATEIVNDRRLKLSPTKPELDNLPPSDFFSVPANYRNGFRYSFVKYSDNQTALATAQLILKAKRFRKNSKFLSTTIKLARCCPHLVLPIRSPNESQLENLDCLKSLMHFLSYGFYDVSNQIKP